MQRAERSDTNGLPGRNTDLYKPKLRERDYDMEQEKLRVPTLLLAVWMLIVSIPVTAFAELLQMTTEPMSGDTVYVLAEDQSKRTAFEKHYYCSDGTFVAVTYPEAVHYQNEQGEWVDVDLRLSDHSVSDTYESQSGDFKASFSKLSTSSGDASVMSMDTTASTPAVTLESGDYALSWSLSGTKPASVSAGTYAINGTSAGQMAILTASVEADVQVLGELKTEQPAVSVQKVAVTDPDAFALPSASNQIIYENIFGEDQNVSVRYSVLQNRVEEDFLITAPTDMTSFSMQIECGDLTPVLNLDNSVDFVDNNGEMVYHVSSPYIVDAAFAVSYEVGVTLTEQDGICIITYTPDAEWMNDSARVYPIMLDPAVTTKDYSYAIHDTYLVEGDDTVHYTEQYLNISQNDGKGRAAILRFASLPQIDSSMPIISATLKLPTYIGPNGVDLKLESMSDGFNFLMDRYSDWKTWNRTEIDSVSYTSGTIMFEFDMTSCIVDLYSGSIGRDFSISLTDEDATTYVSPIFSADATFGDSYRPYLAVTYGYTLPASLSADDVIQIQNVSSGGYLYPYSGLIGNGNAVVYAADTSFSAAYRLATLSENVATGAYRIEYSSFGDRSGSYYSANKSTQKVVMHNTSSVPSDIVQDWLIVPYTTTTFKIVLASDMRYVMTADLNDESKSVSITQCNGTPTDAQLWMIYKDDQAVTNTIALSALSITTGTYYINNRETGKFINRNATSSYVGTTSGLIEDIGESIDWQITKLPDGYYTIQSAQHPGKLLTALTISATMSTYNGEVTDAQKWQITGTSEQYYIRALNGDYLYATSGEVASYPLGLQSGNLAPECKWRMATPENYVELQKDDVTFDDLVIDFGSCKSVSVTNTGNAMWVAASDFHYMATAPNQRVTYAPETNSFSGVAPGASTISATHKPTGRTFEFHIIVNPISVVLPCTFAKAASYEEIHSFAISIDAYTADYSNYLYGTTWYAFENGVADIDLENMTVRGLATGLAWIEARNNDGEIILVCYVYVEDILRRYDPDVQDFLYLNGTFIGSCSIYQWQANPGLDPNILRTEWYLYAISMLLSGKSDAEIQDDLIQKFGLIIPDEYSFQYFISQVMLGYQGRYSRENLTITFDGLRCLFDFYWFQYAAYSISTLDQVNLYTPATLQDVIDEQQVARNMCGDARRVIQNAQNAQATGGYQKDNFQTILLKRGTKLYRVCQDANHLYQGAWYTTEEDVLRVDFDYNSVYSGTQMSKIYPNYKIAEYTVTEDIYVATGKALANTSYGSGGFTQYYIDQWAQYVEFSGKVFDLKNIP